MFSFNPVDGIRSVIVQILLCVLISYYIFLCIFCILSNIDTILQCLQSATGVYLAALPPPPVPHILCKVFLFFYSLNIRTTEHNFAAVAKVNCTYHKLICVLMSVMYFRTDTLIHFVFSALLLIIIRSTCNSRDTLLVEALIYRLRGHYVGLRRKSGLIRYSRAL